MGVWFLSISVAQYVAGVVAQFASVETVGGQVTNLKVSLDTYTGDVHDHRLDRDRRRRGSVPALAGRFRSGCTVSNKGWAALALAIAASRLAARAFESQAPPRRRAIRDQRGSLSLDLRPLSGRPDRHPPRHRVRRRRAGGSTTAPSSSPTASSRRSAGRSSPSPAGALEIDGTGKWVTPGVIDVHCHLGDYPSPGVEAQFRRQRGDRRRSARSLGRA